MANEDEVVTIKSEMTENTSSEEIVEETNIPVVEEEEVYVDNDIHSVDDKNRIKFPAKIRRQIHGKFVLSRGAGNVISVYSPKKAKEALSKAMSSLRRPGLTPRQVASLKIYISSFTMEIEEDAQGRFNLPQQLMNWAKIGKKSQIYSIGVGDHIEIWKAEKYEALIEDCDETYSEDLGELGIYG